MNDPKRLRESEMGDFERLLLSSAAEDEGSSEALQRVLSGMQAVSLVETQPSSYRLRFSAHSGPVVAKVAASVVVATLLGVFGLRNSATPPRTAAPEPAFKPSTPAVMLPPPSVRPAEQPVVEAPVVKATVPNAPAKRKRPAPLPAAAAPLELASSTHVEQTESQHLDAALGLLRAHEPRAALVRLDQYEHDFPQGTLAVEAALLKARALVLGGERERAAVFACSFLATHAIDRQSMSGRELGAFCNKP